MNIDAGVRRVALGVLVLSSFLTGGAAIAQTQAANGKKPNILVIFGDDIGYSNISAYNLGMMGYHTPNIDSVARQGALFTDYYAQQSCTAGRAAFITGTKSVPHRAIESRTSRCRSWFATSGSYDC
jgi:hypothetical protein